MSATSKAKNTKSNMKEGQNIKGHALTERLGGLTAQHPKLVRALEKEDASELHK
jgi:hypothetical protein